MSGRAEAHLARIRRCFPELAATRVQLHTSEGQFNDILFVDEELVFRFPRSPEVAAELRGSTEILRRIRPRLPLAVPDPRYTCPAPLSFQDAFVGYPRLPGRPLWPAVLEGIRETAVRTRLAEQLAGFLQALHGIPAGALGPDLPVGDGRADWEQLYADIRTNLFQFMRPDARREVAAGFDRYLSAAGQFSFEPALRHGDFGPSNILYDPENKAISGILDFDSIGLGDPALDAAAVLNLGEGFFKRMCRAYPALKAMRSRTAFYRSTYALQEALYGLRDGVPEAFEAGIAPYR